MQLLTIQHRNVLDALRSGHTYIADWCRVSENLVKPYQHMVAAYGWRTCPVFAAPVGYNVEFYGARCDEQHCLLKLDVPDRYIRYQQYYEWTDFIFFTENPDEATPDATVIVYDIGEPAETYIVQATLPFIKASWLTDYCFDVPERFRKLHDGSGGQNVLRDIIYYTRNRT